MSTWPKDATYLELASIAMIPITKFIINVCFTSNNQSGELNVSPLFHRSSLIVTDENKVYQNNHTETEKFGLPLLFSS